MKTALETLQHYFGYTSFRSLQEEIIQSILDGNDTLALMPTGGGKSLCFQVPALMREGVCLVISPLIALMKDQVENLKAKGISAMAIYSGMSKREVENTLDHCTYGQVKFLYVSPERLLNEHFRTRLHYIPLSLLAIDEAHCISEWGYDFRPAYLQIHQLRELKPELPVLALTATATAPVVVDIQQKLAFKKPNVFKKSFQRPNLTYMVLQEEDKMGLTLRILRKHLGTGIIYVRNRKETQEMARFLLHEGISADFYHAGLTNEQRASKQEAWKQNQIRIMVATNAFGMGIDKPDVRIVLHLELPDSLEAYYQEAGRGGRDEKRAFAVLMYQANDIQRAQRKWENQFPSIDQIKAIYHHLGNYYQLAYGAGEFMNFDFDLIDFCDRFKLELLPTLQAFGFLERDGWISLTESVYLPSKVHFIQDASNLYAYQVANSQHDPLIKLILRTYGGTFDHYIGIQETYLSKKLGISTQLVKEYLSQLHQRKVLIYIPQTDQPQLQMLRPRADASHLFIDPHYYYARKKAKKAQLDAVLHYVEQNICRSKQLLGYFNEPDAPNCGVCDVCKSNQRITSHEIQSEIQEALASGPKSIKEVVDQLKEGSVEQKIEWIRACMDRGWLKEHYGMLEWVEPTGQ
jgi:ATP-dependent DNA helicase RecQ